MAKRNQVSVNPFSIPAMDAPVHIFDVDHTITKHSTGVRMARLGVQKGFVSRLTIMRFPLYYLRYIGGNYTVDNLPKRLEPFAGFDRSMIESWSRATFSEHIEDDIYPEALQIIRKLVAEGKEVILCSSSIDFIIQPLADFLGVKHVLATVLHFEDGVCTGDIVGLPAFGEGKVTKTKELLKTLGGGLDQAAFWSDSINDLPLLRQVKWPVPTNPDKKLRMQAKAAGWTSVVFQD